MNVNESEKERIGSVGDWFSTFDGINGKIIQYAGKHLLEHCIGPRILEMGCADGRMTKLFADNFPAMVAVDGSRALLDRLSASLGDIKGVELACSMFEDLQYQNEFNTVVQSHILEHVADPVKILSIGRRALDDDGVLIAAVPHAGSAHRMAGVKMGIIDSLTSLSQQDIKLGHRRVYTLGALIKDAQDAELKVICNGGFFLKPLSNDQMESWSDELLDAMFEIGADYPQIAAEIYVVCKKA